MARCADDFGWSGVGADAVRTLSDFEIREMLMSSVWKRRESMQIMSEWRSGRCMSHAG